MSALLAPSPKWTLPLRPYQEEAIAAFYSFTESGGRCGIVNLPTGTGKTLLGLGLASRVGRTLWLAHREELVIQPLEKAREVWKGEHGLVRAGDDEYAARDLVVASVPTLGRAKGETLERLGRIARYLPIKLVVVDEAHHALPTNTYGRILADLPGVPVLGLTATVERGDGLALGTLWEKIVYSLQLADAIRDGALAPPRLPFLLDPLSGLTLTPEELARAKTDAEAEKLVRERVEAHVAELAQATAARTIARLPDRAKVLVSCVLVRQAEATAAELTARGWPAACVAGSTPARERRVILSDFAAGKLRAVTHAGALCLDAETEILTDRGWAGINEMTAAHKVANYDSESGDVTFEEPLELVRRPRDPGERMVSLESCRRSVRVTEGHRMLYRTNRQGAWRKSPARDLVGRCVQVPVSTVARELNIEPPREPEPKYSRRKLLNAAAFNLRKLEGYGYGASQLEAVRRVDRKRALAYLKPSEVSEDACRFIGYWIGDGSRVQLASGGVQYTLCQGVAWPKIVEWVDALICRLGFHSLKKLNPKENAWVWSLPRGTGGGSQEREGLFSIEPYLDKRFSPLFWGFNEAQVDALVEGLWLADGNHGLEGKRGPRDGHRIYSVDKAFLDRLQALLVLRGYRVSVRGRARLIRGKSHVLFNLSFVKIRGHSLARNRLAIEDGWHKEEVWCVRTRTSNLVTRRRGSVTFMGNSEGYDCPGIDAVVLARPLVSKTLFLQTLGRATRLSPGKVDWAVLDLSGCTQLHDPFHSAPLLDGEDADSTEEGADGAGGGGIGNPFAGGDREPPPAVRWVAAGFRGFSASAGKGVTILVALEPATNKWAVYHYGGRVGESRQEIGAYRDRELALGVGADAVRRLGGLRFGGERESAYWRRRPVSEKQALLLRRLRLNPEGYSNMGEASDAISELAARRRLARGGK